MREFFSFLNLCSYLRIDKIGFFHSMSLVQISRLFDRNGKALLSSLIGCCKIMETSPAYNMAACGFWGIFKSRQNN